MKTITIIIILTIFCVTPLHPVIFFNYFCNNLQGCPEANNNQPPDTPQDFDQYQDENITYLQAKAATAFLTANANFQMFLAKIEMIEVSRVDYTELNNILKNAYIKIEQAENIFAKISNASRKYQVNPMTIEKLKSFDYKWFCVKYNLDNFVMSEVECWFSTGDIHCIPDRFREKLYAIKMQIEGFRQSLEKQKLDIDAMYQLNQEFITMAIFGQYTAMIFREVRLQ